MSVRDLPPGKNPPEDIYVVIEIPQDSSIKYELDKESGVLFVDRFLFTAMHYPFNYGFIPQTLADDGDPVDVLVVSRYPVVPGSVLRCRPIGALQMRDEEGVDTKLIAVPHTKLDPTYDRVKTLDDLPPVVLDRIKHFFEHYKELEPGKWVKVEEFKGVQFAIEEIKKGIENYKKKAGG
ncbi:Inorganic diphosphatase [Thermocrinis albus DSM 14484]|uniref:Inorganic pyrophosphatase n=1 Tax=Thermocrinis albus (strain DSM 14484 / JCM 11386 / HI 11/12) TaxID=638303 RepID=D3SPA8_THEAH|nr:inorganic diphosphatase [Thermocrinis albus]ADC88995.1 Inorganic diphosphatase [Thermocrinis albus DSM 14484]